MSDPSNLWLNRSNKTYKKFSEEELTLLTARIVGDHGGILKPNTMVKIRNDYYSCAMPAIVIHGKPYLICKKLGQGVYGSVFKGYDLVENKYVAIKKQPISNAEAIKKQCIITRNNGIGLADFSSNSAPAFLMDGFGYFTLPLADISFDKWINFKTQQGNYREIITSLIKITDDLSRIHANLYVHMDLKADNILMIDNIAYIADFGQSERRGNQIPTGIEHYTQYPQMAPEYFICVSGIPFYTVSSKFDLYSMGFLIKQVSERCPDEKIKGELSNISTYLLRMNPDERISLEMLKTYLTKLLYNC